MKRIIVCRPVSDELKACGLKSGIRVEGYPFLLFDYMDSEALKRLIVGWNGEYIFTSQHALIALKKMAVSTRLAGRGCFVISGTTKALAVADGFNVLGEAKNGKELGKQIQRNAKNKLLHLSSPDRKRELYGASAKAGMFIQFVHVYSKRHNHVKIMGNYDAIAFFSPSQISAFLDSGNVFKDEAMVFCIGNTTKSALPEPVKEKALTADRHSVESVMELAIKHVKIR